MTMGTIDVGASTESLGKANLQNASFFFKKERSNFVRVASAEEACKFYLIILFFDACFTLFLLFVQALMSISSNIPSKENCRSVSDTSRQQVYRDWNFRVRK